MYEELISLIITHSFYIYSVIMIKVFILLAIIITYGLYMELLAYIILKLAIEFEEDEN